MSAGQVEVADVLQGHARQYLSHYPASPVQRKIIDQLSQCRTASLGGHVRQCSKCGHEQIAYNSCRNRHCPKCQRQKQADWLDKQSENLLNVPYFHIVFTLPQPLSPLSLQNQRLLYGLLFRYASQALLTIARDPRHFGARIGFTAILHTWGQTLMHHPHLHCLVPAGGLSQDGRQWIDARKGFLVPVRVLSRLFRNRFMSGLHQAQQSGKVRLEGRLGRLKDPCNWNAFVDKLRHTEWVVYAKPAFGTPLQVLKYLARYTHRVAISNQRLVSLKDGQVTFRYKDYRKGHLPRRMQVSAVEFIRRFLLHSLPRGFMRIRHYGILANRSRRENLTLCRSLLANNANRPARAEPSPEQSVREHHFPCPKCSHTSTLIIAVVPPARVGPVNSSTYHPMLL